MTNILFTIKPVKRFNNARINTTLSETLPGMEERGIAKLTEELVTVAIQGK